MFSCEAKNQIKIEDHIPILNLHKDDFFTFLRCCANIYLCKVACC